MDYIEKDFGKLIKKNAQAQRHELLARNINCMRIYDRNLEEFPVTIDLYDKYARVVDFGETPMDQDRKDSCFDLIHRMVYIDTDKIVYLYRSKREKGQQHEKNSDSLQVFVQENGHKFKTELKQYTDTGLFLDHEETRAMIEDRSEGCDVLNLFSYTGSFSVYAAAGGAKTVTSVDLSATYSKWAEENLELNGFTGSNYKCLCMDAKEFIIQAHNKKEKYDIIIFDPPAFSNSRKMEEDFDVARDYAVWIKNLSTLLREGGFILFSTNLTDFNVDRRRLKGLDVKEITSMVRAPGFVKNRKGTVRSWIMANDDNSLTLDWSDESNKKKEYGKREYKPGNTERRPAKRYEGHRERSDNRPARFDREYRERPERFDRERSERPNRYEHSDRYERSERNDRYGNSDRYERSNRYEHSERRERSERTNRYEHSERPNRYEHSDRYERSNRYEHSDRYERPERKPRERYEHTERSDRRREKPYGYDSFRPARNRNDSSDFFWNNDDFNKKRK